MKIIKIQNIEKKELVHRQGDFTTHGAYVYKGCFRYFRTNEAGEEFVTQFAFEDFWIGDMNSLLNKVPAKMNLQALEDATVMSIHRDDFESLVRTCPGFSEFQRIKRDRAYESAMERTVDVNQSAEERYKKLLQKYPQISQRVAGYHMASYLGITPESLSRIRKNLYS